MGGRQATGPRAARIAGEIYRQLSEENYLIELPVPPSSAPPVRRPARSGSFLAKVLILLSSFAILFLIRQKLKERKRRTGLQF